MQRETVVHVKDTLAIVKARVEELVQRGEKILKDGYDAIESLDDQAHTAFATLYQGWYREACALLKASEASYAHEFTEHYTGANPKGPPGLRGLTELPPMGFHYAHGERTLSFRMRAQISLLAALPAELSGRELSLRNQLSFEYVADEYDQAEQLLSAGFDRAAGAVAGVALERHLRSLAENHKVEVMPNPPTKPKADFSDYLAALKRERVLDEMQRKQFAALYEVRKQCSHPEEPKKADIERLVRDGRKLAAMLR